MQASNLNLSRMGSVPPPFTGIAEQSNLMTYKSGIYDMQELFHHLNMGPGNND